MFAFIERVGARLPDTAILFLWFCAAVILASVVAAGLGASAVHPATGETVAAASLLSADNIRRFLTDMPRTFADFPPLAMVITVMIGIGVAERSGLIAAALTRGVTRVPRALLPAVTVFAGIMSSLAVDAGYVVLVPLGAAVFAAAGRHPIAGLAAAFAGVAGGFSANLFITSLDPLLAGITQTAARVVDPEYTVLATANYFVMVALVPLFTIVGAFVCTRLIEPRLGTWSGTLPDAPATETSLERRGLRAAGLVLFATVAATVALTLPAGAPLRDPVTGSLEPFYKSLVALTAILFLLMGLAYGRAAGTITRGEDGVRLATDAMSSLGAYLLLAFLVAHFIAFFNWSNLGVLTAIGGAGALRSSGLSGSTLLVGMVVVTALINLFVGSASAKWAVMATVFVPMFMLVGITPEATQAAYRVGDSVTNIISPTLPYLPLILVAGARYVPGFNLGSLIATMLPFSLAFLLSGTLLLGTFLALGLPLGPGVEAFMTPAG
ncbi:AbgT family transporter [Sandaracinobacteroides saxicola]|uniref:AbgT family transporter n=1 Tax=Sandaracinobacteroides saxicola TaxID=2759707 RepID=A0A7G5IEL8_9SPHN|nr:AbgT family transporter [Sandaracinobacteroides saxicola]QMW21810.1 AbgT family transporter [Sandaracinobacteroides saxicola]